MVRDSGISINQSSSSSDSDDDSSSNSSIMSTTSNLATLNLPPNFGSLEIDGISTTNLSKKWSDWRRQFTLYLVASGLDSQPDKRKVAILLSLVGTQVMPVFNSFQIDESTVKYDDLIKKFDDYFTPKKNITVERHNLLTRHQKPGESIDEYVTALKNLSQSCELGDLNDSLIKDVLILGLRADNKKMKERLLQEDNLDLRKAVALCKSFELSQIQAKALESTAESETMINKISARSFNSTNGSKKSQCQEGTFQGHEGRNKKKQWNNNRSASRTRSKSRQRYQESGHRSYDRDGKKCGRCGQIHRFKCPAHGVKCETCGKFNHYTHMCRARKVQTIDLQQNRVGMRWQLTLVLSALFTISQAFTKWSRYDDHSSTPPPSVDYDESNPSAITEQNPCLVKYCAKGQECRVRGGVARCVCVENCPKHKSPVCGSDGKLYNNHCSLHKESCLLGEKIAVDHTFKCLQKDPIVVVTDAPAPTDSSTPRNRETTARSGNQKGGNYRPPSTTVDDDSGSSSDSENEAEDYQPIPPDCTLQRYDIMKDNLLKQSKSTSEERVRTGKEYIVSTMFTYYDLNGDNHLDKAELQKISDQEHLGTLSEGCSLADLLRYDDADQDNLLSVNEFYSAFTHPAGTPSVAGLSVVSLDKALEVNHLSARVGDNVEIKCDVSGTPPPPLVWRRNNADLALLAEDDVRVFADGSLYLTKIQLLHAGNYTCHAQRNTDIMQTHVLTVHTIPEVKVTPKIQSRRPGEEASMFCHVIGEPFPKVEWLKNDEPLKLNVAGNKYMLIGNGTELRLHNIAYADTGAYMCQATNVGGVTRDISSLIVQEEPTPTAPNEERRFFAFHDWGVSVYEPNACRLYHQIQSTDIIPGTQEYVCGDKGVNCSWGQAINVANRYVYVTQPMKDRVLVISKIQMVVVDVVVTDKRPVALHYVPHLDQVWVLNWRSTRDQGVKTIQVIRDACQKRKHHTVHPEPIDGQFDLVRGLYMPPVEDMLHSFKYGYVSHTNQRGLYKLDLANMRYVRSIDLAPYNCVPQNMQFSALYGLVVVQCEEAVTGRPTGQLVLDALTDSVISQKPELIGQPYVAPDSRAVVTIDRGSEGVTVVIQEIADSGLKFLFDVKTTLNISDVTFYPSQTTHGYDLYASAVEKEDILFLNLLTGKVEMITGVGKAMEPSLAQWGNPNRVIEASGVFGHFMVTPANEALFVVNGESRTVNCEIGGLVHPRAVVWVTMHLQ